MVYRLNEITGKREQVPDWEPTPEEIAARCKAIREADERNGTSGAYLRRKQETPPPVETRVARYHGPRMGGCE